jgi:hypothetical protein
MVSGDERRIAIVVEPSLAPGFLANTIAVISVGLGAAVNGLAGEQLTDLTGRTLYVSANRPVLVLQADRAALAALFERALPAPAGAALVVFPAFARALHSFEDYAAEYPRRDLAKEPIDGVGRAGSVCLNRFVGSAKWIAALVMPLPGLASAH